MSYFRSLAHTAAVEGEAGRPDSEDFIQDCQTPNERSEVTTESFLEDSLDNFDDDEKNGNSETPRSVTVITSINYSKETRFPVSPCNWSVMSLEDIPSPMPPMPENEDNVRHQRTSSLPPPKAYEEFLILSSTKQNVELYKILRAIADEVESLKVSTDSRFFGLEEMVCKLSADWEARSTSITRVQPKDKGHVVFASDPPSDDNNALSLSNGGRVSWPTQGSQNDPEKTSLVMKALGNREMEIPLILNIGGKKYEVSWSLIERLPQTRLGRLQQARTDDELFKYCDGFIPEKNEFIFHRGPRNFDCVINFLRTGVLHLGEETCVIAFQQDLEYWGVDELYLEPCCVQKYYQQKELLNWEHQAKKEEEIEIFWPTRIGRLQKVLWDLFEKPHTSIGARVVAIISITFIIMSTVVLTLNTLPYFMQKADTAGAEKDYPPFALLEAIYMSWFTFEFLIRLLACPSKVKFVKSPMNIIDLLAILPYYVSIALVNSTSASQLTEVRRIAQFFRIMRILRIFKLARHSVGLQSLGFTLKNSYKELGLLMLFLTMGVLIFSSLAYVFENDDPSTSFTNMLDAYWWALITMTTVGYGDISPVTGLGKVIGTCCAISGVLVIALPIPIIGNNFAAFYKNERRREQLAEKKSAMERAQRKGAITPFPGQTNFGSVGGMGTTSMIGSNVDGFGHGGQGGVGSEGKSLAITELDAESLGVDNISANLTAARGRAYSTHSNITNGLNTVLYKSGNMPQISVK